MKKAVILVLIISVLLGVLFWQYGSKMVSKTDNQPKIINLTYWGLREEEATVRPLIERYQELHPNIKITYAKQSPLNYRTRIQTQIRANQGPDIFEIHNSWLPMFMQEVSAAPPEVMSMDDYSQTFYPVAKDTLTLGNKIYGIPSEIDGLALYYNEDILKAAGIAVPKTWQEFVEAANKVTVRNQLGQIQTAGAAMGTTTNIDFWPEIVALLFLQQPESDLASPANKNGVEVLQFYTSFIIDPKNKTWDTTLPSSTKMFTEGKLAFYFAPSSRAQFIKETSPSLPFKVVPVPQLPGRNVSFGSFWAEVVSSKSPNSKEAWEFIKYLTSPENLQFVYQQDSPTKIFGKPFPRVDMANLILSDPLRGAYVIEGPYYKSWYLNSTTQDAGINEEMVGLFGGAVNDILQGKDTLTALEGISPQIKQVLDKYTKPPVATPSKK